MSLRDELRRTPVDEEARARTLRVVLAAHREAEPAPRRWTGVALVAACVLASAVVAVSVSGPGSAVARWVRDVIGAPAAQPARPALVRVPGGGRLLVSAPGAWVVAANGARRRLGGYAGASWSPNGLFVVAWRGGELLALEPDGGVRWSLARSGRIAAARWGTVDGFRVAYLSGGALRVVNGDGTGDRRLAPARAVAPAWRADDGRVLAYVDRRGRVRSVHVDSGRELWRSRRMRGITELAWSGDRLVASARGRWTILRDGRMLARRTIPAGTVLDDVAWAPDGRRLAVVRRDARASTVVLEDPTGRRGEQRLFSGPGEFGDVAFSPDGRRLLVPWPTADQWLFLGVGGGVDAVANIGRQFAGGPRGGRFPGSVEWISARGR